MAAVNNAFTGGRWIMESKPQVIWGIPHSSWFFAMGIGGALFINRALFHIELGRIFGLIMADVLSMIFIAVGGLILIADLGKPSRLLRAVLNPRTSWISVGAICDFIFLILDGLWLLPDFELNGWRPLASLPWAGNSPLGIAFQLVAGLSAFIVIIYPGLVLAYSPSIPFWNTTLVPLEFLVFGFVSALGLAMVFTLWIPVAPSVLAALGIAEALLLLTALLFFVAHILNGIYTHTTAKASVSRLMSGELKIPFLWGTILGGLVLPLVLSLYGSLWASRTPDVFLLALAGVITLAGNWFSKYAIIKAGMYAPFL